MVLKDNALQKISNAYEKNPIMRAIIQVVISPVPYGIGSAIDAALTSKIENMREERLRIFFDRLANSSHLTEELIQREEFLHAYFSTLKAAVNTRRAEKIKLFSNLLITASKEKNLGNEKYEEFLRILDELSMRELRILLILKRFEYNNSLKPKSDDDNDFKLANCFWEEFKSEIKEELELSSGELRALLNRLNRTGLYENISGMYLGYTGGKGKLTPIFFQFIHWINAKESDFIGR